MRAKHEVIRHQLKLSRKEVSQHFLAIGAVENVCLFDDSMAGRAAAGSVRLAGA
jgi:hypothetical protein